MRKKTQAVESGRIYGGESAADRLIRQRRQFMDAGLELFGTVGYRATTVRMLCREAELIDRYFYKNFTDTEELLAAIYTERFEQIQADLLQTAMRTLPGGDAEQVLKAMLDQFFKALEHPQTARVCLLEVLGISARIDALYLSRIQKFSELILSLARGLVPNLQLFAEEANLIAIGLIGSISQSATHWLLGNYRIQRQTLVEANALILGGAIRGLRERGVKAPA